MSADEDEDEELFTVHALTCLFTSSADRQKKAFNYFNRFLQGYCPQIGIDVIVDGTTIPYRGIPRKSSNKAIAEFWDKLFGNFIYFMGNKTKLAASTSEQYCSGVKTYFVDKFRTETPIPTFQQGLWKQLLQKLRAFYRESNRATGKRTEEKATSTRRDREALATACIWLKTPQYAEFWHLLNASYHCCGRGSEVSLIKARDTQTTDVNELTYNYEVITTYCQRQKDNEPQNLPIYPHRDGILQDFYFSLLHLLVLNGCNNEYTFPIFSKAALKTKGGKSDSGVSKAWTKLFDRLRETFEILADEINEELSSHSNRKGSNQDMAECLSLNGMAGIFRTGWSVCGLHSVFDYINGSLKMSHQAGKALANWTFKIGETIVGGQPPTFDDIETDVDTLKKFTNVLFEDDVEKLWNPKVRELLVMTLLLRYNEFCEILECHPLAKLVEDDVSQGFTSSTVRDNPFLCRIHQALVKVHAEDLLSSWTDEARKAFLARNMPGLPIENFSLYGGASIGNQILIDPRCFVDHFNALASVTQSIHMNVQRQQHMLNDMRNAIQNESRITSTFIVGQLCTMNQAIQRLERNLIGEAPEPTQPKSKGIIKFSINTEGKNTSLTELTTAFFAEDYRAGYALDQRSGSWDELSKPDKRTLINKFGSMKRAVRFVLMHADEFPPTANKEEIRRIAKPAEDQIRQSLQFEKDKVITHSKLERKLKLPAFREIEKKGKLPENTPEDWRKFFE
ncbi:expressed unknown protein [Seminavis robusta]|uniref:Uncharacterized protein n=1 Tax=Seminavis robusta TaxID=568900 RepID=A0A9N8E3E6_9STRA|nr:expressed unknown protein [Seminavis robusta]|eukprot:Sro619_g176421.1  (736) ;mRNA; r:25863-28070